MNPLKIALFALLCAFMVFALWISSPRDLGLKNAEADDGGTPNAQSQPATPPAGEHR